MLFNLKKQNKKKKKIGSNKSIDNHSPHQRGWNIFFSPKLKIYVKSKKLEDVQDIKMIYCPSP